MIEPGIDRDAEITSLYNRGKERQEIAVELGLTPRYITNRLTKLRRWGWLTRESRRNQSRLINSELRVYISRGMEEREILNLTGLTPEELHERLDIMEKNEHKYNRAKCRRHAS